MIVYMNTKPTRAAILVFVGLVLLVAASFIIRDGAERLSANFPSVEPAALVSLGQSLKLESAPRLVNGAWPLGVEAKAFAVALVRPSGELDILLEKNGRERLPIASIAKLLTAMVAADELEPAAEVVLRPEHFLESADSAGLKRGEHFLVRDLLYPLLISSSNAAAVALASEAGQNQFVVLMNQLAESQGFRDTYFYNPTGLDPGDGSSSVNYSTADDLVKIARLLILKYQPLLAISRLPEYDLYSRDRTLHHHLLNTDKFVNVDGLPARLLGGKTGQTDLALKNILLIFETAPLDDDYLVVVVLGAADHFQAAERLLNWVYQAYEF